jgi:RNA polymerase sigma-70 factor (ECF subfamily)
VKEQIISDKIIAEQDLIKRWQDDDPDAFDALYAQHSSAIYRLGWAMLQQAQSAEDVVQETFLRAYRARHRYDSQKASFSTWLYQIALNYCRSHLRRKSLLTIPWLYSNNDETPDYPDGRPGPEMHALRGEYRRLLWEAVQNLSMPLREVVTLHYYMEIPAVEVAKMLGCPEGTIYSRLHNARRTLAKSLTAKGVTGLELLEPQNVH